MAVLSADRQDMRKDGDLISYPVIASETIYGGGLVSTPYGHATNSGYARAGTNAQHEVFLGVARERADNSSGSIGDEEVQVWTTGEFLLDYTGTATQADVGKVVYLIDDGHVGPNSISTSYMIAVGVITRYDSSTQVFVRIDGYAGKFPDVYTYPAAATADISRGDIVCQADTAYVNVGADTANYRFVGVAIKACDNSTGAAGAKTVSVVKEGICYFATDQAIANYLVGMPAYVEGAQEIDDATSTNDNYCGDIVRKAASGNYVYVAIDVRHTS